MRERIIEFLFNGEKYRAQKLTLFLIFSLLVLFYGVWIPKVYLFGIPYLLACTVFFLKMGWYNRKKGIRTTKRDWLGVGLIGITIMGGAFLMYQEQRIEHAVEKAVEDETGAQSFTIQSVNEREEGVSIRYRTNGINTSAYIIGRVASCGTTGQEKSEHSVREPS